MSSSSTLKSIEAAIEKIILDPRYHAPLTLVKGVRNGIVYGTKIRFPHALVMMFLFRSGTVRQKLRLVYKATRQHARNLALFALVYKSSLLLLKSSRPSAKEGHYDTFLAGLTGGYLVFGRTSHNPVTQQIVIYVFARVMLAMAKVAITPRGVEAVPGSGGGWGLLGDDSDGRRRRYVEKRAWTVFSSLSWACVMYLFRWHPENVQSSLRSSMHYIYVQSDHWDSLRNFILHNK
ncbi:peroxisomal membrane protein 4 [Patellaria atrata CBS 101060]|uniref:Peroxisomal membrane protein 4 n=1 Tax=Patellaria atrata CBS 101060 TaxID=1346257 RepID=A0A9P4S7E8_9PEZI|nr:peroxisomal membrane protein 4 [Patellaria atrata CBS 101060]